MSQRVQDLREVVDRLDAVIAEALRARVHLGRQIVREKAEAGLPAFDRTREGAIERAMVERGLSAELVVDVWGAIFRETRG